MTKHFKKIAEGALHYLPASEFHPANTYFHFSFANYYNPDNMNFGSLRVLNDDDVKPHEGFGRHPHRDIEIISYVVKGTLTHWDKTTNKKGSLTRGSVQTVTAGKGIWHSEENKHDDWMRFLQIWILPPAQGLPVRYENHHYALEERENKLLHIVGNTLNKDEVPLHLNQNINLYVSELTNKSAAVTFSLEAGRQAYINNFEGSTKVKGLVTLNERDSMEIIGPADLEFSLSSSQSHFIIIEMPASKK